MRHVLIAFIALTAVLAGAATASAQVPECERATGPFAWSCARAIPGMSCTQILETADPHTWNDNYFCATAELGLRWSSAGAIPGMRCTQILETADPHTWNDNFLCAPQGLPVRFRWSSAGPVPGMQCVQWLEPADPNTWSDNFLCWAGNPRFFASLPTAGPAYAPPPVVSAPPACESMSGPFAWSCARAIPGMSCTQITEPADPHTWNDNHFCSASPIGMRWSHAGAIPGMRCTQVLEAADPNTWSDNFLCVPPQSDLLFQWSSAGPVPGLECVQWNEPSDPHTWQDNFLCWGQITRYPRGLIVR